MAIAFARLFRGRVSSPTSVQSPGGCGLYGLPLNGSDGLVGQALLPVCFCGSADVGDLITIARKPHVQVPVLLEPAANGCGLYLEPAANLTSASPDADSPRAISKTASAPTADKAARGNSAKG